MLNHVNTTMLAIDTLISAAVRYGCDGGPKAAILQIPCRTCCRGLESGR